MIVGTIGTVMDRLIIAVGAVIESACDSAKGIGGDGLRGTGCPAVVIHHGKERSGVGTRGWERDRTADKGCQACTGC